MPEGRRLCWRCDEPITAGQKGETTAKLSASGGGADIDMHARCNKKPIPYVQRTPSGLGAGPPVWR